MSRAQSTLEYAVLIAVVAGALLAMSVYLKRSMQGRLRQTGDELGQQYAPKNTAGSFTTTYTRNSQNISKTYSEKQLNTGGFDWNEDGVVDGPICDPACDVSVAGPTCNPACDLNNNGKFDDEDVFASVSISKMGTADKPEITTQSGSETVGPLEDKLFN